MQIRHYLCRGSHLVAVEAIEGRRIVDHGDGVYGCKRIRQGNYLDEGVHWRVGVSARRIPTLLRQPKCHLPCKECFLPLEDQAHLEEIPLALRSGRRKGFFLGKNPHN